MDPLSTNADPPAGEPEGAQGAAGVRFEACATHVGDTGAPCTCCGWLKRDHGTGTGEVTTLTLPRRRRVPQRKAS